ncbi:MAG TPA: CCA tRNA nucleotidyltransferase [Terracidiphilus sp.]|jgi:tRNA nucleotidyltransferase/poly(A) polymerase
MPDYIYLLENRLSADQKNALRYLRDAAREAEMILFLTGDAVRDLTSGHAVRDIEVAVHGNALSLKKPLANVPVQIWGEDETSRTLYLCFPGTVRVDVVSTHRAEYPKPGQPVFHPASIQEDLRRRDFTANAMAISLNEGSFGLLMDPLNGAADIEARTLRLVSNYGFLEEPAFLIRATRYRARLGWELDPKTQTRYENAKGDGVIELLSALERSRELEQIGHEDDGLKVLQALEAEGWMKVLDPHWTSARVDEDKLKALHQLAVELLMQGVHADVSAAQMQLLTSKMPPKELAALKKQMLRPGFVEEWNSLDALASGFAKVLLTKENQQPSASFKLFTSYDPEAVLWLGFTTKDTAVKERFNLFLKVWPETRQRLPHALMQEMRVKPELPNYTEIIHSIFLKLIDGELTTAEEMRAFLEPYSPPAPPPQVTIKRTRAKRGAEAKVKDSYDDEDEDSEDDLDGDDDLDDMGGDEDEIGIGIGIPKVDLEPDSADAEDSEPIDSDDDEDDEDEEPVQSKRGSKSSPALSGKAMATQKAESTATVRGAQSKSKSEPASDHGSKTPAKTVTHEKPSVVAKPSHAGPKHAAAHAPVKSSGAAKSKPAPVIKKAVETHPHKAGKAVASKPAAAAHKPAGKVATKPTLVKSTVAAKHNGATKGHAVVKPAAKKPATKKH